MKEQFLTFIKEQNLVTPEDKILLTVSGGIDSMTMLHLFKSCGFNVSIAHCNFTLRGAESDGDEELVTRTAQQLGIALHINRFDTLAYAEQYKLSIQMAARELRYNWFNQLAQTNNYARIATAHNANDVVETMLINLTRGTGIHGLTGIGVINGDIIRPLLFASRTQIEQYVKENNIAYREDSSNAETKYIRNEIRHNIIPRFEQLNPAFRTGITNTARILNDVETVYNAHIERLKTLVIKQENTLYHIQIAALINHAVTAPQLFELLSEYDFTFDTAENMLKNLSGQPGACYYSRTHKIVKDRSSFILYPLKVNEVESYTIQKGDCSFDGEIKLELNTFLSNDDFTLKRNREVGSFDIDKLSFPLTLRRWKKGDIFYPFGMRGKKKISDYFSDQKMSIPEKENTWILCSAEDIIWVVNHRTDNRFCITKNTREILQIELID